MKFPVLSISKKNTATFIRTEDELTSCTKLGLSKGHFNGLVIVDSEGEHFEVLHAEKVAPLGPFWGFNIFGDQRLRIKLVLKESSGQVKLEDFKKLIMKVINSDRGFWSSGGSVSELIASVKAAESYIKTMELLR